jgi:hypothetical protein
MKFVIGALFIKEKIQPYPKLKPYSKDRAIQSLLQTEIRLTTEI